MKRLPIDGTMYRLQINGKQLTEEVESIFDVQFTKDIVKTKAIYRSDNKESNYRYEDAVIDCKNGFDLDFKIFLDETDIICHSGKCKVKKVSKHYPEHEATIFKIKFEVI